MTPTVMVGAVAVPVGIGSNAYAGGGAPTSGTAKRSKSAERKPPATMVIPDIVVGGPASPTGSGSSPTRLGNFSEKMAAARTAEKDIGRKAWTSKQPVNQHVEMTYDPASSDWDVNVRTGVITTGIQTHWGTIQSMVENGNIDANTRVQVDHKAEPYI
jgi:hypothetical protein